MTSLGLFPFLISYGDFLTWFNGVFVGISSDIAVICYFIFSFSNLWFIITLIKFSVKFFKKVIRLLVR